MDPVQFATQMLIALGAGVMAANIVMFRKVSSLLKAVAQQEYQELKSGLLFHQALIVLFFVGYILVFVTMGLGHDLASKGLGNLFVGVIFFFGALFVFLGIVLQKRMLRSLHATSQKTLDAHQRQTKTNAMLTRALEENEAAQDRLKRSYDTQTVVNTLLKEALGESSVKDLVNRCLDLVLSLPWLSFEAQGSIFLADEKRQTLSLMAQRGFSKALEGACQHLPFGTCLCGRAAQTRQVVFVSHVDDRHEILVPGTPDHGHYCIPVLAKERTLGVLNIYVKPGHERNAKEEEFLTAVANTLAMILVQRKEEEQRREIELKLQQAQKMESIGTLAGGIAHDFNNILSGIFGYVQLAERHLDNPEKVRTKLHQITSGARRASDLIQQILTFSRKSEHKKMPVRLCDIVSEAVRFLRSSIPASIQINETLAAQDQILANATQIHQIVLNLGTNAFHAMREKGGEIFVSLGRVSQEDLAESGMLGQESWLELEIRDTGAGMTPEVLEKIFDPYFTTKEVRQGTGLGLSVVLGIVKEHQGEIRVESWPGYGTCFRIYFPVIKGTTEQDRPAKEANQVQGGKETLMLVDDEPSILGVTSEFLREYGYEVPTFSDPVAAIQAFESDPNRFDLVITDMTMPQISGQELARRVLAIRGEVPVILCTGYNDTITKNKALCMGIRKFLQKPVDSMALLQIIRSLLDRH